VRYIETAAVGKVRGRYQIAKGEKERKERERERD